MSVYYFFLFDWTNSSNPKYIRFTVMCDIEKQQVFTCEARVCVKNILLEKWLKRSNQWSNSCQLNYCQSLQVPHVQVLSTGYVVYTGVCASEVCNYCPGDYSICYKTTLSVHMCLYLDLKVVVYVWEEDHLLFVPGLCVIWFDPSSDPPSLASQPHNHLVMWHNWDTTSPTTDRNKKS